ncbi:hypothetical protein SE17_00470 [Kouleothrix aurantiaca]|uniref:Uncharacterized protein n=1 Tax=Kouleothrix aurantiaca TaxID=186479 RepID=A0A0P9DNB2_9CHLR|nr:hypothetical protein SE17_00470 [Kouleothrix aurantiaca]
MTEREKMHHADHHHDAAHEQRNTQAQHNDHSANGGAAHQRQEHGTRGEATATQEIVAHFPTAAQARQAAQAVDDQVVSTHIEEVSHNQVHQEAISAQMGVTTVEIGLETWVGLALGALAGVVVGILIYSGRIALPAVAPALASGAVASVVFSASLLAIAGALIGALLHLFRAPAPAPGHELHAVVSEDARPDVEQMLVNVGALDVLVLGDGAAKGGNGRHQQASAMTEKGGGHH